MDFVEWFDVNDLEHIKAYCHLERTGLWPKGFMPDDATLDHRWPFRLQSKLVDAWVHYVKSLTSVGE